MSKTTPIMSDLASHLQELNPFERRSKHGDVDNERGEVITSTSVAGGGHGARQTGITKTQLRVSHALRSFLYDLNVLSAGNARLDDLDGSQELSDALEALLNKSHIDVPSYLTDRSHTLPEYFISSSHNTYLMANQLYGVSSVQAYERALATGSRCVEIDAWDNDEDVTEPKVTHGYTLVTNIKFSSVCETIRDVFDKEAAESVEKQGLRAAPILISLENHCNANGQKHLIKIMKEVWGDRLLSEAIRQEGHEEQGEGKHVCLNELGAKIAMIVEHHIPGELELAKEAEEEEDDDASSSSGSSEDEEDKEEKQAKRAYKKKKEATAKTAIIIPELAALGVYAQSVKPADDSWYNSTLKNGPHHHLINISESGLTAHMLIEDTSAKISRHNSTHLMRVFPKGTRITSKNLNPVPFWGIGAQICALNWQTFGAGMQLNEALFSGSDGYVLKPSALRAGGSGVLSTGKQKSLRLHVAGASEVPIPPDRDVDDIKPYVTCMLLHPDALETPPPKRKTKPYHHHLLGFLHKGENPPNNDPFFNETLEWQFEDNELVFLRILIKSDDSFAVNPVFAVAAVRLSYVVPGWRFIRMLDLKGRETKCSLLVRFEITDL